MFSTVNLPQQAQALSLAAGLPVRLLESTHSTNQVLLDEGAALPLHPAPPCVLIALAQTAGRGRRGRAWQDLNGSFLGSMGVSTHLALPELAALPLYVGVALAQCLRGWGLPAQIKWPNDVWVNGAKIAGILVETRSLSGGGHAVVIGVGVNDGTAPQIEGRRSTCTVDCAAQLNVMLPPATQRGAAIVGAIVNAWAACAAKAPLDFAPYDALHGLTLTTDTGLAGVAVGINPQGLLGLRTAQGVQWIHSGELSIHVANDAH